MKLFHWLSSISQRIRSTRRRSSHRLNRHFHNRRPGSMVQPFAVSPFTENLEDRTLLAADFGDAPDPNAGTGAGDYETIAANGGPSHTIDVTQTTLFLGNSVDGDSGTLQNAAANADDVNGALPDDEDGVLSPATNLRGTIGAAPTVTLLVTNTTGSTATLSGWIDYNNDGVFDNATERATATVSTGLTDTRLTLTFPAIPTGFTGTTYARFRLSTDAAFVANPTATGAATDGEVEDYAFAITSPSGGTVKSQVKISDGLGGLTAGSLDGSDYFGDSVAGVGDLDGDGVADIAVGARRDENTDGGEGAVYVLLMNSDGTVKSQVKISDGLGGLTAGSLDGYDYFGSSVAGVGDLDGDGVPDIAVGARSDENTDSGEGAVYVLLMNSDGTVKSQVKISDGLGGLTAGSLDGSDRFGSSVAGVGDLDGDGVADIAVGAERDENTDGGEGAVYVLLMNSDGTVKSQVKISDGLGGLTANSLDGNDLFGSSVAGVGDLDGDGVADIAVGAQNDENTDAYEGAVYVLLMNSDGTVKSQVKISDGLGGLTAGSLDGSDLFGSSVAGVGDLDGDGVADIAVGAASDENTDASEGAVYVLLMNSDGTVKSQVKISDGLGGLAANSLDGNDRFGSGVAFLGDLDGDGVADIAVGAYRDENTDASEGAIYILSLAPPVTDALSASLDGSNNLVITETGGDTDDGLTVTQTGATTLTVQLAGGGTLGDGGVTGVSGGGTDTLTIDLAQIGGAQIIINAGGGDDTLTIDLGDGSNGLSKQVVFNGEGQNNSPNGDTLVLNGSGTFATAAFGFTNETDGTIDISGNQTITYTGLEPVTSNINATDVTLNYSTTAETITVSDAGSGQTTVDSDVGGETTTFNNPTGTLTINAGDTGANIVDVEALAASYPASIMINGGNGSDTVNLNGDVSLVSGQSLTINADAVNTSAGVDLVTSGAGAITITADDVALNATSTLTSAGSVSIAPQTAARGIRLGGETAGQLSLTDVELDRISAASLLIGNATAGTISADDVSPAGVTTLHLTTGANVARTGGDLAVPDLAVSAVSGIDLKLIVTNLAAVNTTSGIVNFGDTTSGTPLTIGVVDGVTGLLNLGGALTVVNAFAALTIDENISASGNIVVQATSTNTGNQNLRLSAGHSVISSGGSVEIRGGDTVNFEAGSLVQADTSVLAGMFIVDGTGVFDFGGASIMAGTTVEIVGDGGVGLGMLNAGGTVTIRATNGSVFDSNGDAINVTAPALAISVASGPRSIGSTGNPIETAVSNMELDAPGNGEIGISNTSSSLELGGVTPANGTFTGVRLAFGPIVISTSGTLSITTPGDTVRTNNATPLTLNAADIVLGTSVSASSVTLNAATGSITTTVAGATSNVISAGAVNLSANTGIGTAANPMPMSVSSLRTDTSGGNADQFLAVDGSANVNSGDLNAGNGTITLDSGRFVTGAGNNILSDVIVTSGATLGGSGEVIAGTTLIVQSGAVIEPGGTGSTARLRTANIALQNGASFLVDLNGTVAGSSYDQLQVTGTVSLGDATLGITTGFSPSDSDSFTIIDNDGTDPVTGTFNGLAEGAVVMSGGNTFRLSYLGGTGNDVVLTADTLSPQLNSFTRQAPTDETTNADSLVFRVTFSEPVVNVDTADFVVNGTTTAMVSGVITADTGAGLLWDVTVSGGDLAGFNGTLGLDLDGTQNITDQVGNALPSIEPATDETYTLDNTAPTPSINGPGSPTGDDPFNVTIDFGETVIGFVSGDITVGNGSVTNLVDNGSGNFTATIDATSDGAVTIDVAGSVATDAAGNSNTAATQVSVTVDTTAATPMIASTETSPSNAVTIPITVTFGESVTGFDQSDLNVSGGAVTNFSGDAASYSFDITPGSDGTITVDIAAAAALDSGGNATLIATQFSIDSDQTAPTVDIAHVTPDPRTTTVESVTIVFSEAVSGFGIEDLSLTRDGGAELLTGSQALTTSDNVTFTLGNLGELTSSAGSYLLTLTASGSAIVDAAGNVLAGDATDAWSRVLPTVTLSIDEASIAEGGGATTGRATLTATLSQTTDIDVTVQLGFTGSATLTDDFTVDSQSIVINAGSSSASIDLTAVSDGLLEANENAFVDIIGVTNGLEDGTQQVSTTIVDDDVAPAFTSTATPEVPENQTFVLTVVATDADVPAQTVTYSISGGVDAGEFSISSGGDLSFDAAPDFENPTDDGMNNFYEVQVTADDGNGGVTTQDITVRVTDVDEIAPTVSITAVTPDPINSAVNSIEIVFSEAVTGFDLADLTLARDGGGNLLTGSQTLSSGDGGVTFTLGNLSGLTGNDGDYVLTLTDAASGIQDAAGNALAAGATEEWLADVTAPTVDISDVDPDPRNSPVGAIEIVFDEAVSGFDLADLSLTRDTGSGPGSNLLTGSQTLSSSDGGLTFTLGNLTAITGPQGTYTLRLTASAAGIQDSASNSLAGDATEVWTTNTTAVTATITEVTPDPRNTAVGSIEMVFSTAVSGFDVGDLVLTRDTGSGPGGNLLIGSESLSTSDNTTYSLSDVSGLTGAEGSYTITLTASGSGIQDSATNMLAGDASDSFTVDTIAPTATITEVTPDPRNSAVASVTIVFSEAVSGIDIGDFLLTRDTGSGPGVNLLTGGESIATSDNISYTLSGLAGLTGADGDYEVTLNASGSGIVDTATNLLIDGASDSFTVDMTAPTATIMEVTPDPRNSAGSSVTIVFDEEVSGVDIGDLTLTRDTGSGPGTNLLTGGESITTSDNITYTLSGLAGLTGADGDYEVTLNANGSGITDAATNALAGNASDTFTVDTTVPTVTITEVTPDPRNSAISSIEIVFSEVIGGFDIGDLSLTRDGGGNLLTSESLTTSDNIRFTLGGLTSLTDTAGDYILTLTAAASGISDTASNALGGDATESWTVDTTAPTVTITDVAPDPRNSAVSSVEIVFSTMVTGFDIDDLTLIRDTGSGPGSNLLTGTETLTRGDSTMFTLGDLGPLTNEQGVYTLTLTAAGSNIHDGAANTLLTDDSETWTLDSTAPGAVISLVTPNPRSTSVTSLTIEFNEAVTGFDIHDLTLTRDTGSGPGANLLTGGESLTTSDNITFTLSGLSGLTGTEGDYRLTLTASGSGIVDVASNTLGADAVRDWTVDTTGPTLSITPDASLTNAASTTFTFQFNEAVTGFDASDVGLTNGSAGAFTSVDADTYTLVVLPVADGVVSVSVANAAAVDAALNNSGSATASVTSDRTAPTPAITSTESSPTANTSFEVTIDFGESVTGFDAGDISVGNGSVLGAVNDNGGGSFTVTINAAADGEVIVDVAGSVVTDAAGNANTAGTQFSIDVQTASPVTVRIDGPVDAVVEGAVVEGADAVFTVTLSEASDVDVSVALALMDGTATLAGNGTTGDFGAVSIPGALVAITFEPGEISKTVTVSTNQDGVIEPDETFSLSIAGVAGAEVEDGGEVATATIDGVDLTIAPIDDQTIAVDAGSVDLTVASVTSNATPATLTIDAFDSGTSTPVAVPDFVMFNDHGDGTGTFTFNASESDLGMVDLTVTATDSNGSTTETFTLNVVAADVIETTEAIRINSAGGTVAAPGGAFVSDRFFNTGSTFSTSAAIDVSDPSLPMGTPAAIFRTTRWDGAGGSELRYSVPVDPGEYLVRLYFAEIYGPAARVGGRVFDVSIEGGLVLDDFDVFVAAGAGNKAIAREFIVTSDGSLDIDFGHVVENPDVMAIEIVGTRAAVNTGPQIDSVSDQSVVAGNSTTINVSASDADGDAITLSASGLPDFASFTDNGNGTGSFMVAPDAAGVGEYLVTMQSSSGSQPLTDGTSFRLSVTAPVSDGDSQLRGGIGPAITSGTPSSTAPTVSISGPTGLVNEGDDAVFTVTLSSPFNEQIGVGIELVDGDATLADGDFAPIVVQNSGAVLTAVVPFQPGETSKEVSIRTLLDMLTEPPEMFDLAIAGAFSESGPLTVTVSSATATIDGVVIPDPVLSLAPVADQTIAADTGPVDLMVAAASSDDIPVMFSVSGLPAFASFIDNGDGTARLVFDPTAADVDSTSTIEITATDSSGSVMETFNLTVVETEFTDQATSIFRINAGGGAVAAPAGAGAENRNFSADSFANTGNLYSTSATIDLSDPSLPENTPAALFRTTRWDGAGGPELNYNIPTGPGEFEVILYFAEIYGPTSRVGGRVFDVAINGETMLENFDVFAAAGTANKAIARRFNVSTNGETLNIAFAHEVENPNIMAIEIINRTMIPDVGPTLSAIPNQSVSENGSLSIPVSAFDENGDAIVLQVLGLPSFATFMDHGNGAGVISVNPSSSDAGDFAISVQATSGDQDLTDLTAFELALNQLLGSGS